MKWIKSFAYLALLQSAALAAEAPPPSAPPAVGTEVSAPVAPAPDANEQAAKEGRRDPFRPFLNDRGGSKSLEVGERIGLRSYAPRQLKVVAVMWDLDPPRAVLQDSGGMGFVVTPGTPIGYQGGVIAAIEPGRVIVEEKVEDIYGHLQVTREVLELTKEGPRRGERERK